MPTGTADTKIYIFMYCVWQAVKTPTIILNNPVQQRNHRVKEWLRHADGQAATTCELSVLVFLWRFCLVAYE